MLQVAFIRQNVDLVKSRLGIRNFNEIGLIDTVIELDDLRKKFQAENDQILSQINAASKEIGQLMSKGEKEKANEMKKIVADLKSSLQPISEKLEDTEKKLQDVILKNPQHPFR